MELVHEEEVIDILEPGEAFGHPSLLTGLAPAFTVRAHEDSTCYVLARDAALEALGRPAGVDFVARSMRERLTRTGHTVHALPELGTVRVPELISRPPLFCEHTDDDPRCRRVDDRAWRLRDPRARRGPAVHRHRRRSARARRRRRRRAGMPQSRSIARDAVRVGADRLAVDAVVDMLESGVDHLVVEDRRGTVLGIVSATDLMGFETWSPFALRHAALRAQRRGRAGAGRRRACAGCSSRCLGPDCRRSTSAAC